MFASSIVTVVLAASSAFAAPHKRQQGGCDTSQVTLKDTAGLPAPSGAVSFVGVGVGTQNYTCGSAGTYTAAGAVADIFDISCLAGKPEFDTVQDHALNQGVPPNAPLLGQHFFIKNADNTISPRWDFSASQKNADAVVVAKVDNKVNAPTGAQDVPWLQLSAISGALASQVYRVDTRQGQPPASCTAGSADITVKYTSKYYFFGGSIKAAAQ